MRSTLTKGMILITIIFMDILTGMEFDLFVPSFPQLQSHFNLTAFWVEALLSVNFISYCLSLFFVGELADRFGRKSIILLGLVIFVIGSTLCLWSPSYLFMLIGRFLQGIGIAAPAILSFLIIADLYPLKDQPFLLAMLNAAKNVSVAAAPVVGSYITLYFHWHGNFIALLVLGLMTLIMTLFFIPFYKLNQDKISHEQHGYISLLRVKPLFLLMVTILFIFVPYWVFVGMSPLLYIKDLGVSLSHFGYYQGVLALVFALGSLLYGILIKEVNYDQKKMLILALLILIIGFVIIAIITIINSTNPLLITLSFLPFIIGQIIPTTIIYPLCINFLSQAKGKISAIIGGASLIFSSLGLQIAGYFYQGSFRNVGIVICSFILVGVIALFFVIKNEEIMRFAQQ